jgi:predicted DNA-binding WGR domain protein
VDREVPGRDGYHVYDEYHCKLNQTNIGGNNNKYYIIQILENKGTYSLWTRWGRVGEPGQNKLEPCGSSTEAAIRAFEKKFRDKTQNAWDDRANFKKVDGKYTIVETEDEEGSGDQDVPLGKLSKPQIEKGQVVLDSIEAALNGKDKKRLDSLSSEFYSLIPHNFGRQRPEAILTFDKLMEKVELLKFYLRMGFEDLDSKADDTAPISGVMDLPLPATLAVAAKGVCSAKEVEKCVHKGKALEAKQAGSPKGKMGKELYGSIMLYTGNAIYRDLNQALRDENRAKVKKYFTYLRMFLEAIGCLPAHKRQLWRGVGVDLYDQYPVGSTITWWGVSSCTSDINVAKGFMNGCGGKRTLLTVHAQTACDISTITFYSNEKENLLAPGTQLLVKESERKGDVTYITLQEVGRCVG